MLADFLEPHLKVVFCGTAAGTRSSEIGHYYAGRGNAFWTTLYKVGLTPEVLAPQDDWRVVKFGIGLTDVAKGVAGMDRDIPQSAYAPDSILYLAKTISPQNLAFNGLNAARSVFGKGIKAYGLIEFPELPPVWVLPSTSGAARQYFDISQWQALADQCVKQP